jgi:predicted AAA+ superfamily ATPase
MMIYRDVFRQIEDWLHGVEPKILVLRGARQVGKTTAVSDLPALQSTGVKVLQVNLEEHRELETIMAANDAERILEELSFTGGVALSPGDIVFLDEVQAAPSTLQAMRYLREHRPDLRFAAAGSLLDLEPGRRGIPVPVGRMEYLFMGPLTFEEFLAGRGDSEMELELIRTWAPGKSFPEAAHSRLLDALRTYLIVGGMPGASARYLATGDFREAAKEHASILNTYRDDLAKYASEEELLLLRRVFDWVPGRAGDKVVYTHIAPELRAEKVRKAIDWLISARVIFPVSHSSGNGVPLSGEIHPSVLKLFFLDVGLMAHMTGITRITADQIRELAFVNRSRLAEQFIAQHLLFRGPSWERPVLHYWLREGRGTNAEVDFLVQSKGTVVPVEVKAGKSGSMKSLLRFVQEKGVPLAVRFDANPPSRLHVEHMLADGNGASRAVGFDLLSLPLYMVGQIDRIVEDQRS